MKRKKKSTFRSFAKKNGFYIAMVMFVAAGAIASYAAVMNLVGGAPTVEPETEIVQNEPELSVPLEPGTDEPEPKPTVQPEQAETILPADESEPEQNEQTAAEVQEPFVPVYSRPVAGSVSKPFSGDELVKSETMNDWRTHNGADYSAAVGESVYAVFSGEVTRAENDPLIGNLVELKLDTGYHVLYANLAAFDTVEVGQRVSQGDLIGTVGTSALIESAELPHLHFELRSGDKRLDPESLF